MVFCYYVNSVCTLSFSASTCLLTEKGGQEKVGEQLICENKEKDLEGVDKLSWLNFAQILGVCTEYTTVGAGVS